MTWGTAMQSMYDDDYETDVELAMERTRLAGARGVVQWPRGRTNAALRRASERRQFRMIAIGAAMFLVNLFICIGLLR
jgi:hypothetical protein